MYILDDVSYERIVTDENVKINHDNYELCRLIVGYTYLSRKMKTYLEFAWMTKHLRLSISYGQLSPSILTKKTLRNSNDNNNNNNRKHKNNNNNDKNEISSVCSQLEVQFTMYLSYRLFLLTLASILSYFFILEMNSMNTLVSHRTHDRLMLT
jgi:hypothetical protein